MVSSAMCFGIRSSSTNQLDHLLPISDLSLLHDAFRGSLPRKHPDCLVDLFLSSRNGHIRHIFDSTLLDALMRISITTSTLPSTSCWTRTTIICSTTRFKVRSCGMTGITSRISFTTWNTGTRTVLLHNFLQKPLDERLHSLCCGSNHIGALGFRADALILPDRSFVPALLLRDVGALREVGLRAALVSASDGMPPRITWFLARAACCSLSWVFSVCSTLVMMRQVARRLPRHCLACKLHAPYAPLPCENGFAVCAHSQYVEPKITVGAGAQGGLMTSVGCVSQADIASHWYWSKFALNPKPKMSPTCSRSEKNVLQIAMLIGKSEMLTGTFSYCVQT